MARINIPLLWEEIYRETASLCRLREENGTVKDQLLYTLASVGRHLNEASFFRGQREGAEELAEAEKACREAVEWLSLLSRGGSLPAKEADRLIALCERLRRAASASAAEREERLAEKKRRKAERTVLVELSRLILKPFDGRLAASLPALFSEEEKTGLGLSCSCGEEAVKEIDRFEAQGILMAVMRKGDGALVGIVGLKRGFPNPGVCQVVLGIKAEYRLRGYGTEALRGAVAYCFEKEKTIAVLAFPEEGNEGSVKLLRNVGFVRHGVLPCAGRSEKDLLCYALIGDKGSVH